jgi:hypothetical protein
MSALPPEGDMPIVGINVCYVPNADLASSNRGACLSSFCEAQAVDAAKTYISCEECRHGTDRVAHVLVIERVGK